MTIEMCQKYWEHLINFRFKFINFWNDFLNSFILIWTIEIMWRKRWTLHHSIGLFVCVKRKSNDTPFGEAQIAIRKLKIILVWMNFPNCKLKERFETKNVKCKKSIWLTCYAILDGTRIQLDYQWHWMS